jgi:hypothetical protein
MPKRKIILALLASMVALLVVTGANAEAPGPEPLPPYTGIIKNNSIYEFRSPRKTAWPPLSCRPEVGSSSWSGIRSSISSPISTANPMVAKKSG